MKNENSLTLLSLSGFSLRVQSEGGDPTIQHFPFTAPPAGGLDSGSRIKYGTGRNDSYWVAGYFRSNSF